MIPAYGTEEFRPEKDFPAKLGLLVLLSEKSALLPEKIHSTT